MSSIRTVQPAHQQPGRRGEDAGKALADARANYDGASRYETRLRPEAAEQAAAIVENMPFVGGRKTTAERSRRECC